MIRKIDLKKVGGVVLDIDLYHLYRSVRYPGDTIKELLNKEYRRELDVLREKINYSEGKVVIERPIFVWFPEDLNGECIIVSDMELWFAAKFYEHPTQEQNTSSENPIRIEWQNVYKIACDEDAIKSLITSYGPKDNFFDMEEIARERGYKRIDLYHTNADIQTENVREPDVQKDTSADSENSLSGQDKVDNALPLIKTTESILPGSTIAEKIAIPREVEELVESDDLKNLLPPLDEEQYGLLKQDLLESGECIHPLVVWKEKNLLIDGHNRRRAVLEIKKENDFEVNCRIRYVSFQSEDEVILWMLRNQLVARNLSEYNKYRLLLQYRESVTEQIKDKRFLRNQVKSGKDNAPACSLENPTVGSSDEKIVKDIDELNIPGYSKNKLSKVRIILREAEEEDKERLDSGKTTINAVYQRIKKEKEKKETKKQTCTPPKVFIKANGETQYIHTGGKSEFILISCLDSEEQEKLLGRFAQVGYAVIDQKNMDCAYIVAVERKKNE